MKRFLALMLALLLVAAMATPVFAALPEDSTVSPRYAYIGSNYTAITINKTTYIATCNTYCYAPGYTVEVEAQLQWDTGSSWATEKTWTGTGSSYADVTECWAVSRNRDYRLRAVFSVYDDNGHLLERTASADYP